MRKSLIIKQIVTIQFLCYKSFILIWSFLKWYINDIVRYPLAYKLPTFISLSLLLYLFVCLFVYVCILKNKIQTNDKGADLWLLHIRLVFRSMRDSSCTTLIDVCLIQVLSFKEHCSLKLTFNKLSESECIQNLWIILKYLFVSKAPFWSSFSSSVLQ